MNNRWSRLKRMFCRVLHCHQKLPQQKVPGLNQGFHERTYKRANEVAINELFLKSENQGMKEELTSKYSTLFMQIAYQRNSSKPRMYKEKRNLLYILLFVLKPQFTETFNTTFKRILKLFSFAIITCE